GVTAHRVNRDLHLQLSKAPDLASGPFDGDDLPAPVVPAFRAHAMRQLDLATLRARRTARRGKLVVRPTLAPARLRVTSFRQRHGRCSSLSLCGARTTARARPAGDRAFAPGTRRASGYGSYHRPGKDPGRRRGTRA